MKITKSGLLGLSLLFTITGLGLMSISIADRQLYIDLNNAVHFIEKVKIISTGSTNSAILSQVGSGSVKINTNNFILTKTGNTENTITGQESSILGGENNAITGKHNVIIGGTQNNINGTSNVIVGGKNNTITGSKHSAILGSKNNITNGDKSVILGSNNRIENSTGSIVVGKNSRIISGNYSAALGSGSKVNANNSFLWNDGNRTTTITQDNVFAIIAKSGMIVNSDSGHNFAKLTLGGPLIVSSRDSDQNIKCEGGKGGGILKMVNAENQMCLCSCDGSGRNSMLGKGRCTSVCDYNIKPVCGTGVTRIYTGGIVTYSGSCDFGKPAKGTGSYFVDKKNLIHWSCETEDGSRVACSGTGGTIIGCVGDCGYRCVDGEDNISAAEFVAGSDGGLTENTKKTLYPSSGEAAEQKCAYFCNESMGIVYDIIDGVGFCRAFDYICDEENLSCEKPLITGNYKEEIAEYTWDCLSRNGTKMNEKSCKKCREENGYYKDNEGNCVPLTCHHCAHKGFPYCFPIDFSPLCQERTYLNP